jgi:hypothetical protein
MFNGELVLLNPLIQPFRIIQAIIDRSVSSPIMMQAIQEIVPQHRK